MPSIRRVEEQNSFEEANGSWCGSWEEPSAQQRHIILEEDRRRTTELLSKPRPAFPVGSQRPHLPLLPAAGHGFALPKDFKLSKCDIVGKNSAISANHVGNQRFAKLLLLNIKRYQHAASKESQNQVVAQVYAAIRDACPSGGMLEFDGDRWRCLGREEGMAKLMQCFEDLVEELRNSKDPYKRSVVETTTLESNENVVSQIRGSRLPEEMSPQQRFILERIEDGFDHGADEAVNQNGKH